MSLSKQEFRSVMSLYPTGVAIITTEPNGFSAFGMTVNSFTSLSLDPPLIMWNLQKSSDTYKAWYEAETFGVNFLKVHQQELSNHYARKGEHDIAPENMSRGITGCPLLTDSLASLECKMHARYEEGDHVIIIGEVVDVQDQPDEAPLVFHKGSYTAVN